MRRLAVLSVAAGATGLVCSPREVADVRAEVGPEAVASIRGASGVQVFLDLKLHDIPATVAGAARAVARLRPGILTVHAAAGTAVIRAAVQAAPDTKIAAVTVLTSLGDDDLARIGAPPGRAVGGRRGHRAGLLPA